MWRSRGGPKGAWSKALSGLVLPASPWTVEVLLRAYVEQVRGRRLMLTRDPKVASPGGPSGLWVPGEDTDLVWAHPAITGVQLNHVLGHELGHMVNGDEPDPLSLLSAIRLFQSQSRHTSSKLWEAILCRADGTSAEERERKAEDFGYYVERWVTDHSPRATTLLESNMRDSLDT